MKKLLFCLLILAVSIFMSCQMTPDGPELDFSVFNGVDWSKVSDSESGEYEGTKNEKDCFLFRAFMFDVDSWGVCVHSKRCISRPKNRQL